jgi:nucleotide-binding universal stress UspA family protein
MYTHTLATDRYRPIAYRSSAARGSSARARAMPHGAEASHAAPTRPASINELLVVLSASEPHRDVALRAQLIARDTAVSRAVLFTPPSPKWQRLAHRIAALRSRIPAFCADMSARILRATFPAQRTHVYARTPARESAARATESDFILVGRRRTFPWSLAPLARYARTLLRRTRTPVLVVGSRPAGAYRNVVIATDLATDVAPALKWARHIAPEASLTFLHVYRGLFESKLQSAGIPSADVLQHRFAARQEAATGMTALVTRHRTHDVRRTLLAHGSPVHDVVRKARELGADLIVVVRSNHSWWAEVLGASASVEIAASADRDVLVVHAESKGA